MELKPTSVTQYLKAKDGSFVEIHGDVGNVVKDLQEINPDFRVRVLLEQGLFIVYQVSGNRETLVGVYKELDQRIVQRAREFTHPSYDYAAELEKMDAEAEKKIDYKASQDVGEKAERLHHALRKELGLKKNF